MAAHRRFWRFKGISLAVSALATLAACSPDAFPFDLGPLTARPQRSSAAPAVPPAPKPSTGPVDRAAPGFVLRGALALERPLDYGDYAWSPEGVAPGPRLIVVSIAAQRVYVYQGGVEIGRSSMLYGADDKPTPLGTFPSLEKRKDHVSNLYGAPMPHMLRLTWDGVALHGSEVEAAAATHGCIGLPDDFAELLFADARVGDTVIVAQDWLPQVYRA